MLFWIVIYIVLMIVIYSLIKNNQTKNTIPQIDDKKDKIKEWNNFINAKMQVKKEEYEMQRHNNVKPLNVSQSQTNDIFFGIPNRQSIVSHNGSYTKNNSFPPPTPSQLTPTISTIVSNKIENQLTKPTTNQTNRIINKTPSKDFYQKEFQNDNRVFTQHNKYPFYKRFGLDNGVNFYITKSAVEGIVTESKEGEYYLRILPWNDYYARDILKCELGDNWQNLKGNDCVVSLLGDYVFDEVSIKQAQYDTQKYGKYTIHKDEVPTKIDIENFSRLREVIPTGEGAKAIFENGTYIIDGVAGSGKSTIAIQKIKLLQQEHKSVLVIVKDDELRANFATLAESMGASVDMKLVDDYFKINPTFYKKDFDTLNKVAKIHFQYLKNYIYTKAMSSKINVDTTDYNNAIWLVSKTFKKQKNKKKKNGVAMRYLMNKIYKFKNYDEILESMSKDMLIPKSSNKNNAKDSTQLSFDNEHTRFNKDNMRALVELVWQITNMQEVKKQKYDMNKYIEQLQAIANKTNDTELINDINQAIEQQYKNPSKYDTKNRKTLGGIKKLQKYQWQIREFIAEYFAQAIKETYILQIVSDLIQKAVISHRKIYAKYLYEYIMKNDRFLAKIEQEKLFRIFKFTFDTIIVDEAQNLSPMEIESIRVNAKNMILTGDTKQNNNANLREWSDILNYTKYRIFSLTHNYRQVYELAQMAYNYRQLLDNKEFVDIQKEYFENQKGFDKPKYYLSADSSAIGKILQDLLQYRNDTFLQTFPIAFVCQNHHKQQIITIKNMLHLHDKDLQIVDANQVQGKQYPIVIAIIDNTIDDNLLYVILTRAQYSLIMISFEEKIIHNNIETLARHNDIKIINLSK